MVFCVVFLYLVWIVLCQLYLFHAVLYFFLCSPEFIINALYKYSKFRDGSHTIGKYYFKGNIFRQKLSRSQTHILLTIIDIELMF